MKYEKSSPISNKTMETLGEFFQHAREKQGLSLDQVASQTRIPPQHLQALEEEDYASLPAKVFTKGFVRSYARTLGLDEDEALQLFLVSSGSFYERTQPEQHSHVQLKGEVVHRRYFSWNWILILMLIIGGVLFFLLPEQKNSPPPIASKAPLTSDAQQPAQQVVTEPSDSISPATPVERKPPPAPLPSVSPPAAMPDVSSRTSNVPLPTLSDNAVEPDGPLVLEIEATQLTWVVVQSDHQAPHEALLQSGQRVSWKAQNQFVLTLGNAAGVVIRLNGESRGPFGKPGEVVRNVLLKP